MTLHIKDEIVNVYLIFNFISWGTDYQYTRYKSSINPPLPIPFHSYLRYSILQNTNYHEIPYLSQFLGFNGSYTAIVNMILDPAADLNKNHIILISNISNDKQLIFKLQSDTTKLNLSMEISGNSYSNNLLGNKIIDRDTSYNIAFVYDYPINLIKIYVDAHLDNEMNIETNNYYNITDASINIGGGNGYDIFNGSINSVYIFNKAFTENDLQTHIEYQP